jgi:Copper binding proteins, plastocyanin/azurin family
MVHGKRIAREKTHVGAVSELQVRRIERIMRDQAGKTATVTFNRPGTYNYTCTPHPYMIGQIIVTGESIAPAGLTPIFPTIAGGGLPIELQI